MEGRNFLEKLLDGATVEWKPLGEILLPKGYIRGPFGSAIKKQFFVAEGILVYEQQHAIYDQRDFRYFITKERAESLKRFFVKPNDMIISCSGTIGRISIINQQDRLGVINQALLILRFDFSRVNIKFIKYYFECFPNLIVSSTGGAITNIEKREIIEKIPIPIPCPDNPDLSLAIQAEIVRILDTFTELTRELTRELTARKKQYHYYRDRLLTFEDGEVEWKPLSEIGKFIRGKRFTKADYADNGITVIHYGEIYTQYGVSTSHALSKVRPEMAKTLRYAEPGDVVITDVGETVEDVGKAVAWLGNEKVAIHDHCYAFRHSMNPKFVSYYMQTTKFIAEKAKYVARTKVNTLLVNSYSKISIPMPSPTEQARIVAILDKFDTLTTDLSAGLSLIHI